MANIEIVSKMEVRPIATPRTVSVVNPAGRRQDGLQPPQTIEVSELDKTALDAVLMRFIEDMYAQTSFKCDWETPSRSDAECRGVW